MIHFVVPTDQDRGIREYLDFWGLDLAPRFRVTHVESLPTVASYPTGTYVLSALDQLPPKLSAFVGAFQAALSDRPGVRFLNHPSRTWRRVQLLDELHRRGRNEFRAVPISADLSSLRYPVFLRNWRSHEGAISPLLHRPAEVEGAIGRALIQGRAPDHLLVVEFCNTADADGYYRKYAAFVVGDRVIPRTLSYSRSWMLKFEGTEFSRHVVEEELNYIVTNPHGDELREIFAMAGVEYGRMDYAVKDGRLQTWEINLNPTIGRGRRPPTGKVPPELDEFRRQGKETFYRRFREAWESVDVASSEPAEVHAAIAEPIRRAALAEVSERAEAKREQGSPWLAALRKVLRPAKPLVAPMVTPVLPLIGRVARRKGS